MKRFAIC